jgi:hypothetical protein
MVKKAASEAALGELHAVVATGLTAVIREGEPVVNAEGKPVGTKQAAPAYYTAAIAFLKNNSITCSAEENAALSGLAAALAAKRKDAKSKLTNAGLEQAAEDYSAVYEGSLQ